MDLQCKISFILWPFQDQKVIRLALFLSNFCFYIMQFLANIQEYLDKICLTVSLF